MKFILAKIAMIILWPFVYLFMISAFTWHSLKHLVKGVTKSRKRFYEESKNDPAAFLKATLKGK